MGGLRFKELDVVRISAADYSSFEPKVIERLATIGIEVESPKTFPGKTSYGDMDLVASEESLMAYAGEPRDDKTPRAAAIEEIGRLIGAVATASTGPRDHASSFAVPTEDGRLFQVDLITHPASVVDYARRFYSWGDTGALISVTARAIGLRNKAVGLHYIAGYSTDQLDIPLPVDFDEALEILGLDASVHRDGFKTQEEVFAWLMAGREFDPRVYDASYLTERSRRRARARPMQVAFQQICGQLTAGNASHPRRYEGQTDDQRYADMAPYRARAKDRFPFLEELEAAHIARFKEKKAAKAFYSAEKIHELTELEGEDLKLLMWQLTKQPKFAVMLKKKDARLLAEMLSQTLAWWVAIEDCSGETGETLRELIWEITKHDAFGGDVITLGTEKLSVIIEEARRAIAEAKERLVYG